MSSLKWVSWFIDTFHFRSFSPFWQVLKALTEKISNLHLQLVHSWQDLIKDVQRYSDEQHKKHKQVRCYTVCVYPWAMMDGS